MIRPEGDTASPARTMPRAMVFTVPERGHFNPLLGPARALEDSGYHVVWAAAADVRSALAEVGVRNVQVPPGAPPPAPALRGRGLTEIIADPAALRSWIRTLLVETQPTLVEPFRAMIRAHRPDVIAIDTMVYAAAIAAQLEQVPWVGWSTSLNPVVPSNMCSTLIETLRGLDAARHELFARFGLDARFAVSDVLSPRGTAVFTTEALVGRPDEDSIVCVGPSCGRVEPLPSSEPGPLYISFGSQAWYQPQRFERLLRAARAHDLSVVASMGDLAVEFSTRWRDRKIRCEAFVDQRAELRCARGIVTHGGANSVMEALSAGVPMVLAPICNDQPHNTTIVEQRGAGIAIDLERASDAQLDEAVRRVMFDDSLRSAARTIAASYRDHDGSHGAAALARRAHA